MYIYIYVVMYASDSDAKPAAFNFHRKFMLINAVENNIGILNNC